MKITLTGLILILSLSAFGAESWINILCYHRVLPKATLFPDVSIENFEKQMGYIKENFDVISLSDAVSTIEGKMPLTKNSVVVTFDDGDRSIYRNGWPVMKKFKLPFAVFPYTNVVNEGGRGLTWDEMRELSVAGVEFGSHGISHYFMDRKKKQESEQAYEERVKRELIESKETLAEKIGAEITFFAYPFGKFNAFDQDEAVKAGYTAVLTTQGGPCRPGADVDKLNRRMINKNLTLEGFMAMLTRNGTEK